MKLLIEFTPNGGTMQRISNEDIALDHQWVAHILSFSSFRLELDEDYGGYVKPSFSDITVSPEAFNGNWPPSGDALFKIMLSDSDEANVNIIFEGYGTPTDFDREGAEYSLYTPEYATTILKDTVQTGTLLSLMTSYCTTLGLTLDSSNARSTSPAVDYTPSSDTQLIDLMSEMCAFFAHGFKIIGGTLYLHDMLATGTATAISEFDMLPCSYGKAEKYTLFKCGDFSIAGGSSYGDEFSVSTAYHTAEANVESALTDIKTIVESDTADIKTFINLTDATVLDDLSVYDESTISPTTATVKVFSTLYNFNSYKLTIEAVGGVS